MNKTLPLKEARAQLSDLVSKVAYAHQNVVITKFGKPAAALVTVEDYEKVMNPAKRYSLENWDKGFRLMDKARANTRNYANEDVESAIDRAVDEVRKSKRV